MGINSKYLSIFKKFNDIRDELRPKLELIDSELEFINKNHSNFIEEVLSSYSSSDIKRIFTLIPYVWINVNREDLKDIFNTLDTEKYSFDAFFGVFIFLFDIIRLDMDSLLMQEIKFNKQSIRNFIDEKKDVLNNNSDTRSLDLKYIIVDEKVINDINNNLRIKSGNG